MTNDTPQPPQPKKPNAPKPPKRLLFTLDHAAANKRGTTIKELLEAARTKRENSVMTTDTDRTAERATR